MRRHNTLSGMPLEQARQRLGVLARARTSVELGPVGFAAEITETCQAYRDLVTDHEALAALKSEIEALARSGPGARRIYAAMILRAIDFEAGTAALEAMSDSNEPCDLALGGCTVLSSSVGDAVAHLLGRAPELHSK
jgi:hypothetical protein